MKVIHIIAGLNDGGAEHVLFRLVTSMNDVEHTVISLTDFGKYGPKLKRSNIHVISLGMPRGWVTLKGLWMLYSTLKKKQPDVVQTWMYHADLLGGLVAKFAGCKSIYWGIRHSNLTKKANPKSTLFVAKLCALLSPFVPTKIISCAERSVKIHKDFGYKGRFVVIPNGFDTHKYSLNSNARHLIRDELNIRNKLVCGFVARWNPQKDHLNLLRATKLIKNTYPDILVLLIGTDCDNLNHALLALISDLDIKDNIVLLGRRSDVPAIMNALDLHVLSSSSGEAFPNVVAEAMASGTPCVVTDVGDAAMIVGETGWVVPTDDPKSLAGALNQAFNEMDDHKAWISRKKLCSKRVQDNFDLDLMVQRYRDVWNKL
jgi:glycosyltransferase involved in cell wall biosynthesis